MSNDLTPVPNVLVVEDEMIPLGLVGVIGQKAVFRHRFVPF
jgi:hypothetical protein